MISARQNLFFIIFAVELAVCAAATVPPECNRRCGSNTVSFPFGFSGGCTMRLECSAAGEMQLAGYRVRNITSETIILDVPPACNRSVANGGGLFGMNYAMTARNVLFLRRCNHAAGSSACNVSAENIASRLSLPTCSLRKEDDDSISCFSSNRTDGFLTPAEFRKAIASCDFLFVSVRYGDDAYGQTSIVFAAAEIGWWLAGKCQCAADASCKSLNMPDETGMSSGFRCSCNEGFVGDGFAQGTGCRSEECSSSSDCRDGYFGVAVIVGGTAAGISILLPLVLFLARRLHAADSKDEENVVHLLTSEACSTITFFSHKDIQRATGNFSDSNKLGCGAYATVYFGKFSNIGTVAIKRLKHRDNDHAEHVVNEVKLVSSVRHPNLVRLLGCCIDHREHILVYEFVPNGTLAQQLHRERGDGLPWPARVSIAAETAQAVAYLHTAVQPPIYHRDIKSSNILLGADLRPKLADFGLSTTGTEELSHITTVPQGTPGYVDPQYHQNFHLSDRSDVYSFGVVLAEIITGMKAVDFGRAPSEVSLAAMAGEAIRNGHVEDIVDPFVKEAWNGRTQASVRRVAELAFRCLAFHSEARPAMAEVAEELEMIRTGAEEVRLEEPPDGGSKRMRSMGEEEVESPVSVQFQRGSERSCSSEDL